MPTPYKSTTTVVTVVPRLWYGCDKSHGTSVSIAVVTHVPSP